MRATQSFAEQMRLRAIANENFQQFFPPFLKHKICIKKNNKQVAYLPTN